MNKFRFLPCLLRNYATIDILTNMSRREIIITPILVNRITVSKVVIDSHYEEKHSDYMDDGLIVDLVKKLDGRIETPQEVDEEYSYFATLVNYEQKQYRLIWLLEDGAIYIGVLNAYRDDRKE